MRQFPKRNHRAADHCGRHGHAGVDYTTPTGTASFSVVIAAGTYGNQAFKSGIQVTGDTVIEGNETILMSVGPNTNYTLAGISASGAAAKTSTTAPIVDDDLDLIATKTATVTSAANAKMSPLPFASAMRGQFQPPT